MLTYEVRLSPRPGTGGSNITVVIQAGSDMEARRIAEAQYQTHRVEAVLNTGPRTNHPNFVTVGGVNYAYLTVGNLNETLVFRRSASGGPPVLVKRIDDHGDGPHGIWPSPDNTRIYVALQYSDGVDVINTKTMKVIKTLHVAPGQTFDRAAPLVTLEARAEEE